MDTETLKYISFGFSILLGLITFTWSENLLKKSFFNKCAIAAGISSIIGIILEATNILNLQNGITFVVMSVSSIFLIYFGFLLWAFRKLKRFDPYITRPSSWVGDPTLYLENGKYKSGRPVIWEDFVFSLLQGLLPALTILFLIAYLARRL